MAKVFRSNTRFDGGIADYTKDGLIPNSFAWGRSIDYRSDPQKITLLPKTTKESGSVVTDMPKWATRIGDNTYIYGDNGSIYKRTLTGSYSLLKSVSSSHGNGLAYFAEDKYLYYTSDNKLGRYGQFIDGTTQSFTDDFLTSEGGIPTNTYALLLAASSSQYGLKTDTASTSVTGNLTIEAYIKPTSLPAVSSSQTIVSKWNENGNLRSYKFDLYGISGYFGDGSDGSLTISVDTTDSPIDSAATGTINTYTLSATNSSFAAGQKILIHQSQGTGAGTNQITTISSYSAGTITTTDKLNATYTTGAQVLVLKQYSSVTINSGKTWTAKAWNGTTGGILAFLCNGTVTVTGSISASGKGFRGGATTSAATTFGQQGEGTAGAGTAASGVAGQPSQTPNGNGGGAGQNETNGTVAAGGGGGSNGTQGVHGSEIYLTVTGGQPGDTAGSADLTTIVFGGGGGGAGVESNNSHNTTGGNGGGIIAIFGATISIAGTVVSAGTNGSTVNTGYKDGGAGGGAGGSILLRCQTATLGSALLTASAGTGASGVNGGLAGGDGGVGRIHIDYLTSYTGTTSPTLDATQDNTLVTTASTQLRLAVSSDGTALETLTKVASGLTTGMWQHVAVSWTASSSTANFYLNGVNIGSSTGAITSINDNTSDYIVGGYKNGSGTVTGFLDATIDDVRLWNIVRSDSQIAANKDLQLVGNESGLKAYHKFNNAYTDASGNSNTLTSSGSPVFTTDVPFAAPTTRLDIDQSDTSTSQTYTLPTAISEATTDRQSFVPAKDPQKSIGVYVDTKGTGDWTLTVHDSLNRTVASATIVNSLIPSSGLVEFIFSSTWRPVVGATYHFHVTVSTGTSKIVSGTLNDEETAEFYSYYQFLVDDTSFHPILQFLNFIAIGNERYLATYDASTYTSNKLTLPAGYKIRSLSKWNEYLAIGCWKGSNIYDYDEGLVIFWDGFSITYNFFIDIREGGVNALLGSAGSLYIWAGYQGVLLEYQGGVRAKKIKFIPKTDVSTYMEVYPGAVTMWRFLLRMGIAGSSDSTAIERGVYTWGTNTPRSPESLSYDYPISTGNRGNTVTIGMVYPVDKKLLIGWRDNVSCGVDVIDPAGDPYSTGTIEFLIKDEGALYKDKMALTVRADYEPLATGESITTKYKLNRAISWTADTADTTVSSDSHRQTISKGRHNEYQYAIDLATTGTTSPTLLSAGLHENQNTEEELI